MRPLFNKGIRPASFSATLLELHAKQYFRKYKEREHEITRARRFEPNKQANMFSSFGDRTGYAGLVPTGNYLSTIYKRYSASIRTYLNNEVKKRGAEILAWDASYKEAKHLARYHGEPVFKALITGTNEIGEIRVQFHVVTDGHDQMVRSIEEMCATMAAYGQPMPKLFFTDKPSEDKDFFMMQLSSLRAMQERLDTAAPPAELPDALPECTIDMANVTTFSSAVSINTQSDALRNLVIAEGRGIISLDAEWDVFKSANGAIIGLGKVSVIQLGYRLSCNPVKALILQVSYPALARTYGCAHTTYGMLAHVPTCTYTCPPTQPSLVSRFSSHRLEASRRCPTG